MGLSLVQDSLFTEKLMFPSKTKLPRFHTAKSLTFILVDFKVVLGRFFYLCELSVLSGLPHASRTADGFEIGGGI